VELIAVEQGHRTVMKVVPSSVPAAEVTERDGVAARRRARGCAATATMVFPGDKDDGCSYLRGE